MSHALGDASCRARCHTDLRTFEVTVLATIESGIDEALVLGVTAAARTVSGNRVPAPARRVIDPAALNILMNIAAGNRIQFHKSREYKLWDQTGDERSERIHNIAFDGEFSLFYAEIFRQLKSLGNIHECGKIYIKLSRHHHKSNAMTRNPRPPKGCDTMPNDGQNGNEYGPGF